MADNSQPPPPDQDDPSVTATMPMGYTNPNFWGAVGGGLNAIGGDISDLAHGVYNYAGQPQHAWEMVPGAITHAAADFATMGPEIIRRVMSGELQPGTPEFNDAARTTALTYGLPGGAPAEEGVLSAGMKLPPKGRVAPAEGGTFQAKAPMIGQGTATPLFDTSRLTERPDVPQHMIERLPPPAKGVPDWFQAQLDDPARKEQYKAVLKKGIEVGGKQNTLGWWNTMPLRDRFLEHFGPERGDAEWRSAMKMWSATSPRHPFPANIRQGSYFSNLLAEGNPLPELVKKYQKGESGAFNMVPVETAPPGYANFPQHIQNVGNLYDPETGLLTRDYPLKNPKPASMDQNLLGNWAVPTIDVRDLRAAGITTKAGQRMEAVDPASLYGPTEEQFHLPLAKELGMDPAQMQSSTWVGVPSYFKTNDPSGTLSAVGTLEDSIRRTAAATGLTPEQVLQRFYFNKEGRLLQAGDLSSAIASSGVQGAQSEQPPQQGDISGMTYSVAPQGASQ